MWSSLTTEDPFGLGSVFVGADNFTALFADPRYLSAILRTLLFCASVTILSMSVALALAVFADRDIRGRAIYRTLLIWPYAVAPVISAMLWLFILNPQVGLLERAGGIEAARHEPRRPRIGKREYHRGLGDRAGRQIQGAIVTVGPPTSAPGVVRHELAGQAAIPLRRGRFQAG